MLVIFDCDGVLIDSEIIAAEVYCETARQIGLDITPHEMARRIFGKSRAEIRALIEAEAGRAIPVEFFDQISVGMNRRLARVKALPGAHEMLDALDAPICIASNSDSERLRVSLGAPRLYDRFRPFVFSALEVGTGKGKPDPNVFLHAAKTFDTHPGECFVVEDSVSGITGAIAAGMRVIGFTGASHSWPGHADLLTEAGAITAINRLTDVPAVIAALVDWNPDEI